MLAKRRGRGATWWPNTRRGPGKRLCVVERLNSHPVRSSPEQCCWCGGIGDLLPFGLKRHEHAWLYRDCLRAWRDQREEQAIKARPWNQSTKLQRGMMKEE